MSDPKTMGAQALSLLHLFESCYSSANRFNKYLLETIPEDTLSRIIASVIAYRRGDREKALAELEGFTRSDFAYFAWYFLGEIHREEGEVQSAIDAYRQSAAILGDFPLALMKIADLLFEGPDYREQLGSIHRALKPANYLEIGVAAGDTFRLPCDETLKVGVDPSLSKIDREAFKNAHFFEMVSDVFYQDRHLETLLGGQALEMAFIDGMHLFEQALKDFIQTEKYCGKDSVIFFHDCLPLEGVSAQRVRRSGFWTGDVWKVVHALDRFRPDLEITAIPAAPSGLLMVTNLDPGSTVMSDHQDEWFREFENMALDVAAHEEFIADKRVKNDPGVLLEILRG